MIFLNVDGLVEELEDLRLIANKNGKPEVGHRLSLLIGRVRREGVSCANCAKKSEVPAV